MWQTGFWADGLWSDGFWDGQAVVPASLGGWGPIRKRRKEDDEIDEALSVDVVTRIQGELLAGSFMQESIRTAKRRRDETLLLLMM